MIFIILCVWAVLLIVTIWALVAAPTGREDNEGFHPTTASEKDPSETQPVFGAQEAR